MFVRRLTLALPAIATAVALTSCATGAQPAQSTPEADGPGHGEVAGAAEVSEPPLGLMAIALGGEVGILDLLTDERSSVGTIGAPTALASDGRYGFASTDDGIEIIDSGRWSWDHGDHFHYYLAAPRVVGTVPGEGAATVTTGMLATAGATGVFFHGSGEAVLLDNASLADGEVDERFRIETGAETGIVAPLGDGALVTRGDDLVFHDEEGESTDATTVCLDAAGAITTRVGLVVGCSDGAVLATWSDGEPSFEHVPYPADTQADRAAAFDGRKGRPTVAAPGGEAGFWLFDSRELSWQFVPTETPLARVSAVDDAEGHIVGVSDDGRVIVYAAESGAQLAATARLLGEMTDRVSLTVDDQRAYVNDPSAGVVHEIDYADGARVARTLELPTGATFVTEVGR